MLKEGNEENDERERATRRERQRRVAGGHGIARFPGLLVLQTLCPSFKSRRLVSCYGNNTTHWPIVTFACIATTPFTFHFVPKEALSLISN